MFVVTDGNLRLLGKNEDRRLAGRLFFFHLFCVLTLHYKFNLLLLWCRINFRVKSLMLNCI